MKLKKKSWDDIHGTLRIDDNSSMVVIECGAQTWRVDYEHDGLYDLIKIGGFHTLADARKVAERWACNDPWYAALAGRSMSDLPVPPAEYR